MKIHEITLTEAAPGSFTAQLGVLGRNLGQQITKSVLGFDPASVSKNQQSGDMSTALKATSDKLAQTVSNTWPSVVSQVMANSMDPISRSRGVTDFAKIDKALLRKGRLICEHKFGPLDKEDTNKLLKELGKDKVSDKGLTLADIYNIDSSILSNWKTMLRHKNKENLNKFKLIDSGNKKLTNNINKF